MVGVVDIGTNSVRLLVTDGTTEAGRWVEVTGLGRGVDRNGVLSGEAIEETLAVLARFGTEMDSHGAERRVAIATSASRDASNREEFFDLVKVQDAHARANCRDENGTEPWACGECDCTVRLEARLADQAPPFLPHLLGRIDD